MTNVISTRLEEKEIKILNEISKKEHIDRSALLRKFLLQQINEYRMNESAEKYRKGLVSLAEAATLAEVSIYTMMDFCQREQITAHQPTEDELKQEREQSQKLFQEFEEL
jgi:predicted HTH domain antitoxin